MRFLLVIAGLTILAGCGGSSGGTTTPPPTSPAVSLSATTLTFASQAPGTSSAAQAVTVTDSGTATLTFNSIAVTAGTADFSLSPANTCGTAIGAGGACTINVTFTPPAGTSGTLTGTLTITDNAGTQTVSLTGTAAVPTASVSTSTLTFSSALSTTSAAQSVTVTNTGTVTLTFTSIAVTGDFVVAASGTTCSTSAPVAASGGSCVINVTFTAPATAGTVNGTLTISDNASGSPQTVSLSGTGVIPTLTISPTSLTFASQAVGTSSAPQSITVTNTSTVSLTIPQPVVTGDFSITGSACNNTVPTATCIFNVTFTPTTTGTRTGTLTITFYTSPQTMTLSGTGTAPSVSLGVSTCVSFGNQQVSTTSAACPVTVTNNGTASLTFTSIAVAGDFAVAASGTTCSTSAAVAASGGSCAINVTFTPTALGSRTGSLTLTDNASTSPQTVNFTGTGIAPSVSLSPTSVSFSNQVVGTTSTATGVTVTNNGTASLTFTSIAVTGSFAVATGTTCNTSTPVAASGGSCVINLTFTPTATGTNSGSLTLTDNASTSPQTVSLSGTGTAPLVSFSPATGLSFGSQVTSTTSAPMTATVTNTGTAPLTFTSIAVTGDFAVAASGTTCNTSTPVAASGGSCAINVTFTPTATGSRSGSLTLTDNASPSQQTVSLSGTGVAPSPAVTLSPTPLTFSSGVGVPSAAQPVTLTNTGTGNLTISTVTVGGTNASDFAKSADTCTGATVTPNNTCTVSVTFTAPATAGTFSGTLTFTDNASNSPQTVSLTGTGLANTAQLSVNLGPTGDYTNGIFTTVTVCQPGTTTCVAVPNILVDTGSFGLRVLSSALTGVTLTPAMDTSGTTTLGPYYECVQYGDLSYTWGPMQMATVQIGGETATQVPGATANSGVPIQVIPVNVNAPNPVYYYNGSIYVAIDNQCLVYPGTTNQLTGGTANNSVAALGANGILGIGNFAQDCGFYCTAAGNPSVQGYPYMFYDATDNAYILDVIPVADQAWNPVAAFPTDNNGEMLSLPSIPPAGQATATGTLTFGIGTEANNAIPNTATVYQLDNYGYFGSSTFGGVTSTSTSSGGSFLDSGSNFLNISDVATLNAYLNPRSLSVSDCGGSLVGWYCTGSSGLSIPLTVAGTNSGASSTVNLPVGNATSLLGANFAAYNDVAVESCIPATGSPCSPSTDLWDLGLPFFYGKTISIGFEGTTVGGVASTNGYYAF